MLPKNSGKSLEQNADFIPFNCNGFITLNNGFVTIFISGSVT
jgi:hypothetical protein